MVGVNYKKLLKGIIFIILVGFLLAFEKPNKDNKIQIGINQFVEHPALDKAKNGFMDALNKQGNIKNKKIDIEYKSGQGDIPTVQNIAQNFTFEKKDLIFAIGTPAAQTTFNATKDIPILITAVTDPVGAGIVKSMNKTNTNVTGTSDEVALDKQFKLLLKLIPNAKKVGVLYNTGEVNSENQVREAKKIALKYKLELIERGVTTTNEVAQGIDSLLEKVDAIMTPTDNIVASSIKLISLKCNEKKVPIIGFDKAHVESGALATEGVDYYKLGFKTGEMAIEVLKGKNPKNMKIEKMDNTTIYINEKTAKNLNINIPNDVANKMVKVNGGE